MKNLKATETSPKADQNSESYWLSKVYEKFEKEKDLEDYILEASFDISKPVNSSKPANVSRPVNLKQVQHNLVEAEQEDTLKQIHLKQVDPEQDVDHKEVGAKQLKCEISDNQSSMRETALNVKDFPLINRFKSDASTSFQATIQHSRHLQSKDNVISVTKVLKETMPVERRLALQRWEENLVRQIGREKFNQMQETTLLRGERLHSAIQVGNRSKI
jgi:hypothetical protein